MTKNLRNSIRTGLNLGLRQSISGGVDSLGLFRSSSLDLRFADKRTLTDRVSGNNLITFSRSSGTGYGATYVDSDGLIKTSPVNLLAYSEQFDQWTVGSNSVITPNCIAAPDGTFTADLLYFSQTSLTNAGQSIRLTQGKQYTFSVYAKAVTPGTDNTFTFYISSPTIKTPVNFFEATSEWQRFTFMFAHTNVTADTDIYILNRGDTQTTNVYFWGAQLEEGALSDYIPTQDVASGAPRFDHNPLTGESLGLLIEEERTNSMLSSESFTGLTSEGVTVSTSTEVNPEGNASCKRIQAIANYSAHRFRKSDSIAGDATVSCFVKMDTHRYVTIGWGGVSHNFSAVFDIHPDVTGDRLLSQSGIGSFTNIKASYENYLNGWVRIWASGSTIATGGWAVSIARDENASSMLAWTASGTESIFIWGGQWEDGKKFPTSYIPTNGSSVTRSPDIVSIQGNKFAKTNLLTYSERFDTTSSWGNVISTNVIPNATTSPDGTKTADELISKDGLTSLRVQSLTLNDNTEYTASLHVKAATGNTTIAIQIYDNNYDFTTAGSFNPTTGQFTSNPTAGATRSVQTLNNGWYRISLTIDSSSGTTTPRLRITSPVGNGVKGIYIWGAQLEEGELTEYTPSVESFVSRTSGTGYGSTYVDDATGLIKTTPVNLLKYSEQFDQSVWTKQTSVALTPNSIAAPDGTTTGTLYVLTATNQRAVDQGISSLTNGTAYVFSIYIKAIVDTTVKIRTSNNSTTLVEQIYVSEGWRRIQVPFTKDSGFGSIGFFDFSGSTGNRFYLWGAQIEESSTASPYIKTTNNAGGAARYENGELLLEPARSNLLKNSSGNTGSTSWLALDMQNPTTVDGPAGPNTAYQYLSAGGNVASRVYTNNNNRFTSVIGSQYVASCYVKPVNYNVVAFGISANGWGASGNNSRCVFDLSTGSVTNLAPVAQSARAIPAGNGWYRLEVVTIAATVVANNNSLNLDLGNPHTQSHTTDQGFQVYGLQIEEGLFATSLIPTSNSTATRAQDVSDSTLGVDTWYNQSSGTFVTTTSSVTNLETTNARGMFEVMDIGVSHSTFRHYLLYRGVGDDFYSASRLNGINYFNPKYAGNPTYNNDTLAYGYSSSELSKIFYSGSLLTTSSSIVDWTTYTANTLYIGGTLQLNGHIKRLAYFPTLKTDQELVNMTS